MATIDECFKLVKYRATKGGYLGTISPDDFNLLWPRAEMRYFNSQYKLYGSTEKINDTVAKVKSDPTPITIDTNGLYAFPADLLHVDSITHVHDGIEVEVTEVEDDRKANHLSSAYDAPDAEFPIYIRYSTTLKFYPVTLGDAILVYLKKPTPSKWAYTLVGNRPVYDAGNSVQPVWSDTDIDQICYLMLTDLGVNFRDSELENFAITQEKLNA
jgi:hypothetical protein